MRFVVKFRTLIGSLAVLAIPTFTSSANGATSYELISRSTDGQETGYGQRAQVTPDGRYVVYTSTWENLATPTAPGYQIYLFDRATHTTELISISNTGQRGEGTSDYASVSDDGCRVLFRSYATNLVSGAGTYSDIFVRDRCSTPKQTRVVSSAADGTPGRNVVGGPAESSEARISGDGRYATFVTYASNVIGLPINCSGCNWIVRKSLDSGVVDLVSVKRDGTLGYGSNPDISWDGSRIVFWSYSFDTADPNPGGSAWDIYLWDAAATPRTVIRVSTGSNGEYQPVPIGSISAIHSPAISGDGRFVAFDTGFDAGKSALTAHGGNGRFQVYVKDTQTGALTLASVAANGALGDSDSNQQARAPLSHDGRYVSFFSYASNLATATAQIKPLVRDLTANQTILVADRSVPASYSLGFSGDRLGRFVAFSANQTTLDPNFPNHQGLYLADLSPSSLGLATLAPRPASATLRFSVPNAESGIAVTNYLAGCSAPSGTMQTASGSGSPITVFGLANGAAYSCSVLATTSTGAQLASTAGLVTPQSNTSGTTADDILGGTSANDTITGNGGTDTVVFTGPRSGYRITQITNGLSVADQTAGRDGTDSVIGAASLRFSDMSVNVGVPAKAASIAAADLQSLIELYIAYFNRVPDADGLSYWIDQFKAGQTLEQIGDSFYAAAVLPQYSPLTGYSSTMSNADFVRMIYANVLGRSGSTAPPDEDVNYWAGNLASGANTRGSLIKTMLGSAHSFKGNATWGWVADLLDNKIAVGMQFAVTLGLTYNTAADSVSQGMAIARAVTSASTAAALTLIGVSQ